MKGISMGYDFLAPTDYERILISQINTLLQKKSHTVRVNALSI